jgi:hypothetical protein
MSSKFLLPLMVGLVCAAPSAVAEEFSYAEIAKRFESTKLSESRVVAAKMHGECMVGLKRLIFVKRDDFDPVAEWVNYRALSLLEQFPPCEVLIMMQVARAELMKEDASDSP